MAYLMADNESEFFIGKALHQTLGRIDEPTWKSGSVERVHVDHSEAPGQVFSFRIGQQSVGHSVEAADHGLVVHHSVLLFKLLGRLSPQLDLLLGGNGKSR